MTDGGGGRLVVVGTPIGNLADLSPRAAEALASADVIACEDTRRTGRLLELVGIGRRPLLVANDHTEAGLVPELVARIAGGATVALVSDAGMPGVADPGQRVVAGVLSAGLVVEVVPGPSALLVALVASGLPTARFVFEGFLPRKGHDRRARLHALAVERRTIVFYEAPHRLEALLGDLAAELGSTRQAAVARELTKMHDEVLRATLGELVELARLATPRGEQVVVVEGAPPDAAPDDDQLREALAAAHASGMSRRDAVASVAAATGVSRRVVYELAIAFDADADRGDDGAVVAAPGDPERVPPEAR